MNVEWFYDCGFIFYFYSHESPRPRVHYDASKVNKKISLQF